MMLDASDRRRLKIPLHILAAGGSTLLLLLVTLVLAWSSYRSTREIIHTAGNSAIQHALVTLQSKIHSILRPAQDQLELLSYHPVTQARTREERIAILPLASAVLDSNPLLDAWYVGYPNGDFILFRPLRDAPMRNYTGAPANAAILVQTITDQVGEYAFYDPRGELLRHETRPDYRFDPRARPWYSAASKAEGIAMTPPYLFFTRQAMGITLSRHSHEGQAVVGVDAALQDLASELEELKITPNSQIAVVDAAKHIIAVEPLTHAIRTDASGKPRIAGLEQPGLAPLAAAANLRGENVQRVERRLAGGEWQLISAPLIVTAEGHQFRVLMAVSLNELYEKAYAQLRQQLLLALGLLLLSVPGGFWLIQQLVRPLKALAEDTHAVATFEFGPARLHRSRITEVDRLASAVSQMRGTISRFLDMNAALNSETRLERLLEIVLNDVAITAHARSGSLYLYEHESGQLSRSLMRANEREAEHYPDLLDCKTDTNHPVVRVLREGKSIVGPAQGGEHELVAFALETFEKEFVGALVLELPRPLQATRKGRRDPLRAFIEALSSTAAVAIATRHLVDSQKQLLDGLIQLLAGAIDAKSPYTGGHCQRVPEITHLIAQAADEAQDGTFRNFRLSEEDREAINIAAWLHDCGKVTTPEYVVDKATKLETIYNRIHEIRMRFEVLKRDAEIGFLKNHPQGATEPIVRAELAAIWQTLDEEFAFIASCNLGGESLDPAKIERLHRIATRTWQRTLDDRLGLSREEQRQLAEMPSQTLPATENLLADKPEHLVARPAEELMPPDNPWGFHLNVPEYKFNRGELHNLSTGRGTLTDEERYLINDHIVQTIIMLGRLPFPRHLRHVPEIAGGHHERMDGKGYPKGLRREQMSVPARMMAIADVFEALTAADRPYKAPKTLSESLALMAGMVRDGHLDPDLFELFVRTHVYRQYAEGFLRPEQIDEVDEEALLRKAGGEDPRLPV